MILDNKGHITKTEIDEVSYDDEVIRTCLYKLAVKISTKLAVYKIYVLLVDVVVF